MNAPDFVQLSVVPVLALTLLGMGALAAAAARRWHLESRHAADGSAEFPVYGREWLDFFLWTFTADHRRFRDWALSLTTLAARTLLSVCAAYGALLIVSALLGWP